MAVKPKLISDIYDCAINEPRWSEVIDATVSYCGARGALLGAVKVTDANNDPDWALSGGSRCWRDIPEAKLRYIQQKFLPYQIETWKKLSQKRKFGFVFDDEGYTDDVLLPNREDYKFRRENLGIVRSVAYRLNDDLGWFDSFVAHFGEEFSEVPDKSRLMLAELVPHFSKSVELARVFGILNRRYQAVLAALDHVSIGLCIVQRNNVVAVSNAEALRIFDDTGVIRLNRQKQLVCSSRTWNDKLKQAIANANNVPHADASQYENILRVEDNNGHALLVEATHMRDSGAELGEPLDCALVSIVDLSNTREIEVDRLNTVYSLSAAEQAVCGLLVHGYSNSEIAEHRNVSPETVKTQISSIYSKTASKNRIDLIRLALKTSPPIKMN